MQALQTWESLSSPESAMARLQTVLAADATMPPIADLEAYARQPMAVLSLVTHQACCSGARIDCPLCWCASPARIAHSTTA